MDNISNQFSQILGGYLPHLVGALAILVLGWLAARLVAAFVCGALRCTNLDNKLTYWLTGDALAVEAGVARELGEWVQSIKSRK